MDRRIRRKATNRGGRRRPTGPPSRAGGRSGVLRGGAAKSPRSTRSPKSVRSARRLRGRPRGPARNSASGRRPARTADWVREGKAWGEAWRERNPSADPELYRSELQEAWNALWRAKGRSAEWGTVWQGSKAFAEGASAGAGTDGRGIVPLPLQGTASAVVFAESGALSQALETLSALDRLPVAETIVVASAAGEAAIETLRRRPGAVVAHYPESVQADVGRALGAKLTGADIVLFADGRAAESPETYARLLWHGDGRLDVALADRSGDARLFHERSAASRFREFLNAALRRPDLRMNTMASLPFALSRAALDAIAPGELAVPAKAHAAAILRGLKVGTAGRVAGRPAPDRSVEAASLRLAAGDHIEALRQAMEARGPRLQFMDETRNRAAVGGGIGNEDVRRHSDE